MSIKALNDVWENVHRTDLRPAQIVLLLALADYADDQGRSWPSVPTLARKTNQSERGVRRGLKKLAEDGYIEIVERRRHDGSYASNIYVLHPSSAWARRGDDGPPETNEAEPEAKPEDDFVRTPCQIVSTPPDKLSVPPDNVSGRDPSMIHQYDPPNQPPAREPREREGTAPTRIGGGADVGKKGFSEKEKGKGVRSRENPRPTRKDGRADAASAIHVEKTTKTPPPDAGDLFIGDAYGSRSYSPVRGDVAEIYGMFERLSMITPAAQAALDRLIETHGTARVKAAIKATIEAQAERDIHFPLRYIAAVLKRDQAERQRRTLEKAAPKPRPRPQRFQVRILRYE